MQELKLIVAGGRDFNDYPLLERTIIELANTIYLDRAISIVSGMAKGADMLGYSFAIKHNVVTYQFHADWNAHGNSAGFIRNKEMGKFSDALLAFWDGKSKGTKHMIEYMQTLDKPVYVVNY